MKSTPTSLLFREDPYCRKCSATVTGFSDKGAIFDRTIFYPLGGGQPGDRGSIYRLDGTAIDVADTVHGKDGGILHVVTDQSTLKIGEEVELVLDWKRRHAHMRMHTALHLLGAVVPFGVTGGNITAERSRLDFDMQDSLQKDQLTASLNALISEDHPVQSRWITQEDLAAQPELVRTLSVRPPANVTNLRLLEIPGVDLQPCGGTHVKSTGEIGPVRVAKIEKKGRHNRRVHLVFD